MAMREKDLLQIWNGQRAHRIYSQLGPTILLAVVLILTTTGKLSDRSPADVKAFAMGLVAAGGVFSVSQMLSSVRDSMALTRAMREANDISQLGLSVAKNSSNLALTGFFFIALSLFNFVVLAIYLYKKP